MDKEKRMREISNSIGDLIVEILPPIRFKKEVRQPLFDDLYNLLDELKDLIYGEEFIIRSLVKNLLFLLDSLEGEARHAGDPTPILKEVTKIDDDLKIILNDKVRDWRSQEENN